MRKDELRIRRAEPSDHPRILAVMPEWWGGRDLTALLPELFLVHFTDTCFIAEKGDELIGFLVGFLSQSLPDEAYIHLAGVSPEYRKKKIAATLYELFFHVCRQHGRSVIRGRTSPVNTGSVSFHAKMGFEVVHEPQMVHFNKRLDR